MIETWRDAIGYEGLYQVSNLGRVKSLSRYIDRCDYPFYSKERILRHGVMPKHRYSIVILYKNKKRETVYIHRLVGEAFIPNPENKPQIDHIDTIRTNNRVENLRWVTRSENLSNPITNDRMSKVGKKKGQQDVRSKRIGQYTLDGDLIKIWIGINEIRRRTGFTNVSSCCNGRYKQSNGFIWKYEDK